MKWAFFAAMVFFALLTTFHSWIGDINYQFTGFAAFGCLLCVVIPPVAKFLCDDDHRPI